MGPIVGLGFRGLGFRGVVGRLAKSKDHPAGSEIRGFRPLIWNIGILHLPVVPLNVYLTFESPQMNSKTS